MFCFSQEEKIAAQGVFGKTLSCFLGVGGEAGSPLGSRGTWASGELLATTPMLLVRVVTASGRHT